MVRSRSGQQLHLLFDTVVYLILLWLLKLGNFIPSRVTFVFILYWNIVKMLNSHSVPRPNSPRLIRGQNPLTEWRSEIGATDGVVWVFLVG